MLWYIFVCSMIGGISVSVTTGLGAAIVETARGDNQVRRLSCYPHQIFNTFSSSNSGLYTFYWALSLLLLVSLAIVGLGKDD